MKNRKLLYSLIAIAVVAVLIVTLVSIKSKSEEPIHRTGDDNKQSNKSKDTSSTLEKDLDKYREAKPLSKAKANADKASEQSLYLNTDNKVLVQTDSNSA